ncbi:hypothetical protein CGI56_24110 [Vibrio parahaemolyticus]|nr:hypothetical protein CGI56_24110 [Vibrio parahaemolyticus]
MPFLKVYHPVLKTLEILDTKSITSFKYSCKHLPNKAFKSDSQRLAVSLRSNIAKRRSHLNAALCE